MENRRSNHVYLKEPEAFFMLPKNCRPGQTCRDNGGWRRRYKRGGGGHHLDEDANTKLFVHCHFSEERLKLATDERPLPSFSDYNPTHGMLAWNW